MWKIAIGSATKRKSCKCCKNTSW